MPFSPLEKHRSVLELAGVVVESTYNWYWLVDGLQAAGFAVHLANARSTRFCGVVVLRPATLQTHI